MLLVPCTLHAALHKCDTNYSTDAKICTPSAQVGHFSCRPGGGGCDGKWPADAAGAGSAASCFHCRRAVRERRPPALGGGDSRACARWRQQAVRQRRNAQAGCGGGAAQRQDRARRSRRVRRRGSSWRQAERRSCAVGGGRCRNTCGGQPQQHRCPSCAAEKVWSCDSTPIAMTSCQRSSLV